MSEELGVGRGKKGKERECVQVCTRSGDVPYGFAKVPKGRVGFPKLGAASGDWWGVGEGPGTDRNALETDGSGRSSSGMHPGVQGCTGKCRSALERS